MIPNHARYQTALHPVKKMVGVKGFEPSTPWSQTMCATKLRYTPTKFKCSCPSNLLYYSKTFSLLQVFLPILKRFLGKKFLRSFIILPYLGKNCNSFLALKRDFSQAYGFYIEIKRYRVSPVSFKLHNKSLIDFFFKGFFFLVFFN